MSELECFAAEAAATEATLRGVDEWQRPAVGVWDVAALAAHLVRAVTRVPAYLDQPVAGGAAADRVSYWRSDAAQDRDTIAARATAQAGETDPATLPARFAEGWRETMAKASPLPGERLITTVAGPMRLDEFVATRVVELVVHHIDLRAALDLPPASDPPAARLTMAILEALLGGPRPRNFGRARFILAATGRIDTDDPRFPVLS